MMLGRTVPTRVRVLIDVCVLIVVLCGCLTAWLFYDRITTSRATQSDTNAAIRTVLCFAQLQVKTDPTVPADRRDHAVRFYNQALQKIGEPPCLPVVKPGGTP